MSTEWTDEDSKIATDTTVAAMSEPCDGVLPKYSILKCGTSRGLCLGCQKEKFPAAFTLFRLVGWVLAKTAAVERKKRNGYGSPNDELNIKQIREAVGLKVLGTKYEDGWYDLKDWLTDGSLRTAIKKWEKHKKWGTKVKVRRHGQAGNGYRWVLTSETKEWDRREAKGKKRRAKEAKDMAARDTRTADTRAVADTLAERLAFKPGSFQAFDERITLTREQVECILYTHKFTNILTMDRNNG